VIPADERLAVLVDRPEEQAVVEVVVTVMTANDVAPFLRVDRTT